MKRCLMIEINDKTLFTSQENYPKLIQLARTLGAEVSLVETNEELLDVEELGAAICNQDKNKNAPNYKRLQIKIPKVGRPKKLKGAAKMLDKITRIKSFIEAELLIGNEVTIKSLKNKFKNYNISSVAYSNYIRSVKNNLRRQGLIK